MNRRRRAADFSHLHELSDRESDRRPGFEPNDQDKQTTAQSDVERQQSFAEYAKRIISRHDLDSSGTCSFKSTILAGQAAQNESRYSTENSYKTACSDNAKKRSSSIDASTDSHKFEPPSMMNRPINQLFLPNSDLELSNSTAEPRSSNEMNRNIENSKISSNDSRDTNYNISKSFTAPSTSPITNFPQTTNLGKSRRISNGPRYENFSRKILKRLSQEFLHSPRAFTERLVTIIDETEDAIQCDNKSGVDLTHMTKEFGELCKFILDESMPKHMNSTLEISNYPVDKLPTLASHRLENIDESDEKSGANFHTPEASKSLRKVYRKTPFDILKKKGNNYIKSPDSPNSTNMFLYLEKRVSQETGSPPSLSETGSNGLSSDDSNILNEKLMILKKSEEQLASLDDTEDPNFETFDSHESHGPKKRKISTSPGSSAITDDPCTIDCSRKDHETLKEDELSASLKWELVKQRERCFETARKMEKIKEVANKTNNGYFQLLERNGIDLENECIKIIDSCRVYQQFRRLSKNDILKKNEASSRDSGIDSITRTRNKSSLKSVLTNNLAQGTKSVSILRKRSPGDSSPMKNSTSRSKLRFGDELSSARNFTKKSIDYRTIEDNKINEKRAKLHVPEAVVTTNYMTMRKTESRAEELNRKGRNSNGQKATQSTSRGLKEPTLNLFPSETTKASPSLRKSSKQRLTKMPDSSSESGPFVRNAVTPCKKFFVDSEKIKSTKTSTSRSKMFFPTLDEDIKQHFRLKDADVNLIENFHSRRNNIPQMKNSEREFNFNLGRTVSPTKGGGARGFLEPIENRIVKRQNRRRYDRKDSHVSEIRKMDSQVPESDNDK